MKRLTVVMLTVVVIAGCGATTPSPSPLSLQQFQTSARALADDLRSLEWDFHTAVQRGDDAAARAAATSAASQIADFADGPLQSPRIDCIADVQDAIAALLADELEGWQARAEGRNYPDADEISLFFAFYGADKAWILALDQASKSCQQSAHLMPDARQVTDRSSG